MEIFDNERFLDFLLEAKLRTYAAQDSNAALPNPLVPGSTQLEWCSGDWLYRDIYFGMLRFTGQETVYWKKIPVWAMCYSGGMNMGIDRDEAKHIYSFLGEALVLVTRDQPFRGPVNYAASNFVYRTSLSGDVDCFEGREEILADGSLQYALNYTGGFIS